jgi:hypothetical protein
MNLLTGHIERGRFVGAGGVAVPLAANADALHGRAMLLGVRPEHFQLCTDASAEARIRVTLVENTGSETLISGLIGDQSVQVLARELSNREPSVPGLSRMQVRAGEVLPVRAAQTHLFDASTGIRLADYSRRFRCTPLKPYRWQPVLPARLYREVTEPAQDMTPSERHAVEHRTPALARKSVAIAPDDIYVRL